MNISEFLTKAWSPEPGVIALAILFLAVFIMAGGLKYRGRTALFGAGVALMVLAVVSPLGHLGRNYLLSAHMIQHILLLLVVPLFILFGMPRSAVERALSWRPAGAVMGVLGNLIVAWTLGVGSMWLWHVPSVHDAVIASDGLYAAQQVSFVLIGIIFWWPVFAPVKARRLTHLRSTLYLASACLGCTVLGILLTFAGTDMYAAYANPADAAGILPYLRNDLCITPGVDQQIAGLTMWVPGCLIYLTASMITLAQWYRSPEADVEAPAHSGGILTDGGKTV
jgi:putative membrane protein